MISTGELKKGIVIELEGDLWQILEYHHIKVGRGSAQVRIKFRNVRKQSIVEKTFQAGEKFPRATLERRPAQFLFSDGNDYTFMDTSNYDQLRSLARPESLLQKS
jgi:elongation factor P